MSGVNESVLVGALVNVHVPDALMPEIMAAFAGDFAHSKEVVSLLEQVVGNLAEKDVVDSLMLQVKMVPTLPPGLAALFDWLQTTETVTPLQFEETVNAVVVAIQSNESWFTKIDPLA